MIETGIPVPTDRTRTTWGREARMLKVNESILCPTESQMSTVRKIIRELGGRYATRKVEGGWRVWRIE